MLLRKSLSLLCLVSTALCLALGLAKIGQWMAVIAGLVIFGGGWLASKWPSLGLSSMVLVLTVGTAAVGLCLGASSPLMLAAAALGLVNWDLALLDRPAGEVTPVQKMPLLEKKHYQTLLLALGLALPAMLIGRLLHFQIPFGIMILLVILAAFSLTRAWTLFTE